jgi:hypothetical protein
MQGTRPAEVLLPNDKFWIILTRAHEETYVGAPLAASLQFKVSFRRRCSPPVVVVISAQSAFSSMKCLVLSAQRRYGHAVTEPVSFAKLIGGWSAKVAATH